MTTKLISPGQPIRFSLGLQETSSTVKDEKCVAGEYVYILLCVGEIKCYTGRESALSEG